MDVDSQNASAGPSTHRNGARHVSDSDDEISIKNGKSHANGAKPDDSSSSDEEQDDAFPSAAKFEFDVEANMSDSQKSVRRKESGTVAYKAKRYEVNLF